jgi:hypothetical protein
MLTIFFFKVTVISLYLSWRWLWDGVTKKKRLLGKNALDFLSRKQE